MDAVVLAAGEGTRLRPLTADVPKGLVEVDGRPILAYVFEGLVDLDVDRIIVVVGYEGDRIVDRYGDSFAGVPIVYAWQHEREGMAHALLRARPHVEGPFVVRDGDSIVRGPLVTQLALQRRGGIDGTMLLQEISADRAREKAICRLNDAGELTAIEKEPVDPPDPSYVAASFHTFRPSILDACAATEPSSRGEYELSAAIERFIDAGHTVRGVVSDGWIANINTPAERDAAERYLRRNRFRSQS